VAALFEVILPVFLVVGLGYFAVWRQILTDDQADALMLFAQKFAVPCLLFLAIARLDLGQEYDLNLLISFYAGAVSGFTLGLLGARFIFGRPWPDSVAIGFIGMFSNSVLLGLPITERAFGVGALEPNFAIISVHAPICYGIGVTAMEMIRNKGKSVATTLTSILKSMFSNPLVMAIAAGFVVNLSGIALPYVAETTLEMLVRAAIPTALFGLGGLLVRYKPEGDLRTITYICAISLLVHPAITWMVGSATGLSTGQLRSAVVTAAMAPGVNVYLFASIYGVGKRVAASAVLIGTAASCITAWGWLTVLP